MTNPTIITRGDLRAELWLGDCIEVLPKVEAVAHVITDPPFEEEAHTLQRRINEGETRDGALDKVVSRPLQFAALTERERTGLCQWAATACKGWLLAFCQAEAVSIWRDAMNASGVAYKRSMVWIKPDGMPQYSGDRPGMGYESIAAGWCGEGKSTWNGGGMHGVFNYPKNSGGKHQHQTQKPLPLMTRLVSLFSNVGQTVCDPFMGSGTTGCACFRTGRNFIGIERDAETFQVAVDRIAFEAAQEVLDLPAEVAQEALL